MNERHLSEKESLELISQMIQQSREKIEEGTGNMMLYFGYWAVILSVVVYALHCFTGNDAWDILWTLLVLPFLLLLKDRFKAKARITTHIDKAIGRTWMVLGWLYILTFIGFVIMGAVTEENYYPLMFPLVLLYSSIGVAMTGAFTGITLVIYLPFVGFATAIYLLLSMVGEADMANWWHLLFGFSYIVMYIIPGHILNHKAKESC